MNRMIKGSIAGVAGTLLLMGGYGTFALWTEDESLAGDVNSGTMSLELGTAVTWTDTSDGGSASIADISAFRAVPGDQVTLTQPVTVAMSGDHLTGTLQLDTTALETAIAETWGEDLDVRIGAVDNSAYTDVDSGGVTDGVYEFTDPKAASGTFDVTVVFDFDEAASDPATQGGAVVDLTKVALRLSQTRAS